MNGGNSWRAIGIVLIVLLAVGLINARMQKLAIIVAVVIALTLVFKKQRLGG